MSSERQRVTGQGLDHRGMGWVEDSGIGGMGGGRDRKSLEFIRGCQQARHQPSHGQNAKRRALNPDLFL